MKRETGCSASGRIFPRISRSRSAGAKVMERTAADSITKVLVQASGVKSRPACPVSVNTGRKATAMMSSEKNSAGVTSRAASASSRWRSAPGGACSSFLWLASIITISASTVAPMAMAMPAQAHDGGRDVQQVHGDEADRHRHRDREDGQQRRAQVEQEEDDHQRHHDPLLEQRLPQRADGAVDQPGAVVGHLHGDPRRQAGPELLDPGLDPVDDVEGVLAVAHHHDAAHRLAVAVPLQQAAPDVRAEAHLANVAQQHRHAVGAAGADGHLLQVGEPLHVAAAAHVVLALRHLHHPAAHVVVGVADARDHLVERDAVGPQPDRVDRHLVLLLVAAHAGHLGHPRHAPQRVAQREVLEGAQLVEVVLPAPVHQRVLEHPAHPGGVGAERRRHAPAAAGPAARRGTRARGCAPSRRRSPPRR